MAQKTTTPASFGEILLLQKGEKQKLFHCQNGARNPIKEFNVEVTIMLPAIGANTISPASFVEAPVLKEDEKQKFFYCQKTARNDRNTINQLKVLDTNM